MTCHSYDIGLKKRHFCRTLHWVLRSSRRHLARRNHRLSRTRTADGLSRSRTAEGILVGWVKDARKELAEGRSVQVRPVGGSMRGRIESGQLVTLAPVDPDDLRSDDAVLVAWKG